MNSNTTSTLIVAALATLVAVLQSLLSVSVPSWEVPLATGIIAVIHYIETTSPSTPQP